MYHFYNFPLVSFDLSIYIHTFVKNSAINLIIKQWYKQVAKKVIATELIINYLNNNNCLWPPTPIDHIYNFNNLRQEKVNCFDPKLANILNYCSHALTGNEDIKWWFSKLRIIAQAIYVNYYDYNHSINAIYKKTYEDICLSYKKIMDKFDNKWFKRNNNLNNNLNNNFIFINLANQINTITNGPNVITI